MSEKKNSHDSESQFPEANENERLADNPSYKVGYGKPPKRTRFKKGQSGNRKGRPKGSLNFVTMLLRELSKPVEVSENGERHRMSKAQVGMKQLANKTASGDPKTVMAVLEMMRKIGKFNEAPAPVAPAIDQRDLEAVGSLLEFFQVSTNDDEIGGGGKK